MQTFYTISSYSTKLDPFVGINLICECKRYFYYLELNRLSYHNRILYVLTINMLSEKKGFLNVTNSYQK